MFSNNPNWGQTSQNQQVAATNATSCVTIYEEVKYGTRTSEYQNANRFYEKTPYGRRVSEYQRAYKFYEEVPYNRKTSEVPYDRRTLEYQGVDRFYGKEVLYGRRTSEYQGTDRFYEKIPYDRRTSEYQGADRTKDQRQFVAYAFNNGIFIPYEPSGIGPSAQLNFLIPNHAKELGAMAQMTGQDVANFNRSRNSFVGGESRFRGVARHDTGKWQAWTATGEHISGIFETEEEAAIAYDLACIKQKGYQAITNYDKRYYDVNAMLNGNKPKLQGMEVETTWPVTAQVQAYPNRINTNNAGWSNNIQPTIYRVQGFRPAREGLTNFVEILGLEKQDNGSGLRFRHGDFSAFNFYQGMQQIRKPAARNAGFGIGHATASAFQSYKQTETGDQQYSSSAPLPPQNSWLFPPYSVNFEREQWLKAAGLWFKHSNQSHFKVYDRTTMWKGKGKVNC